MTFKEAFAAARKKHGASGTFTWNGKKYHTKYKEEVAAEKEKRKSSPKPKLRPEPKTEDKPKKVVKKDSPDSKDPRKSEYKSGAGKVKKSDTEKGPKTRGKAGAKKEGAKKEGPKPQQTTKQPKSDIVASRTPARSRQDSKAATSGNTRVNPSRPSYARSPEGAPKIAASTVKARESVEAGKKATGTPSTPTTNKQEKMGNTPIREGSYVGTPTKNAPPKEAPKAPEKKFPTFHVWRKTNRGGIVAYNKAKEAAGFNRGGMVRSGSTDRRKGMFYKTGSPNKYN